MDVTAATASGETGGRGSRPTALLPLRQLVRISAYWLGLTAVDAAVGLVIQFRLNYGDLVDAASVGRATAFVTIGGALLAIAIQPTMGSISDYAVTRWGRRKPFIVIGTLLDVPFLLGIAYGNSVLAIAAFVVLLSFSSNMARGPFQGYVPDLVAAPQVGFASAMVGMMQIIGNITGYALAVIAASELVDSLPVALIAVAVVELVTMVSVVVGVSHGQPPKPREGRSWATIALETWGTDILRERSYVWLVVSRLFFLVAGGILFAYVVAYLKQVFGYDQNEAAMVNGVMLAVVAVANLLAVVPAARLSDRIGRKPVIYLACAVGAAGVTITALAPDVAVAIGGAALFGASAGTFLAVDWALMTDIIPKASAGRYMGLSNVATGSAPLFAAAFGGIVMDAVNEVAGMGVGPRAAFLVGVTLYGVSALLLRPVVEPARARLAPVGATAAGD